MTFTLVADEFGLLHAAVPHPCQPDHNIQVMILEAEDGWWAYVDGERIGSSFTSAQQAGRAVATEIDSYRSLVVEADLSQRLAAERARTERRRTSILAARSRRPVHVSAKAIAASFVAVFLAIAAYGFHSTGALDALAHATSADSDGEPSNLSIASPSDVENSTEDLVASAEPLQQTSAAAALIDAANASKSNSLQLIPGRTTNIAPLADPEPEPPLAHLTTETPSAHQKQHAVSDLLSEGQTVTRVLPDTHLDEISDNDIDTSFAHTSEVTTDRSETPPAPEVGDVGNSTAPVTSRKATRQTRPRAKPAAKFRSRSRVKRRIVRRTNTRRRTSRRRRASFRAARTHRIRRVRSRASRRSTRAAIRRSRARKYRRAYRAAFGRN